VVGSSNPLRYEIKHLCESLSNFNFYCQIENMSELISQADLCICAGGTTTWERGVLGLPALTVVCADNQYQTTIDLAELGAIKYLGRSSEVSIPLILNQLTELINEPEEVLRLSKAMLDIMGDDLSQRMSTSAQYILTN
jgi:UDP-2,4-diacetamido-2,4,6-trideoxy-beta-L-altropyranose hydrolase